MIIRSAQDQGVKHVLSDEFLHKKMYYTLVFRFIDKNISLDAFFRLFHINLSYV